MLQQQLLLLKHRLARTLKDHPAEVGGRGGGEIIERHVKNADHPNGHASTADLLRRDFAGVVFFI